MEKYLTQFMALVDGTKLSVLAVLICANLAAGIAVAICRKTFRLKAVADFLVSRVLPYLLSYLAIGLVATFEPAWRVSLTVVWGLMVAALDGAILTNLREMGLPLPDILAGEREKER